MLASRVLEVRCVVDAGGICGGQRNCGAMARVAKFVGGHGRGCAFARRGVGCFNWRRIGMAPLHYFRLDLRAGCLAGAACDFCERIAMER